jgi:hypothetical protein
MYNGPSPRGDLEFPIVDTSLSFSTFSMDGYNGTAIRVDGFQLIIRGADSQILNPTLASPKSPTTGVDGYLFHVTGNGVLSMKGNFGITHSGNPTSLAGAIVAEDGAYVEAKFVDFIGCQGKSAAAISLTGKGTQARLESCSFEKNKPLGGEGSGVISVLDQARLIVSEPSFSSSQGGQAIIIGGGNVTFAGSDDDMAGCYFVPTIDTSHAAVNDCKTVTACCNSLHGILTTNESIQQFFRENVPLVASLSILLFAALLSTMYYRNKLKRARHHSDIAMDLGEPLLSGGDDIRATKGSTRGPGSVVEMVKSLWKDDTMRESINGHTENWQIEYKQLKFKNRIGSGAYGAVFDGVYGDTKLPVAIKRITLSADPDKNKDEITQAQTEVL